MSAPSRRSEESVDPGHRLVVGLGNPGPRHRDNRHNLGFRLLDRIEADLGLRPRVGAGDYLIAESKSEGRSVHWLRPLTWMNRSGIAVRDAVARLELKPEEVLVVVDDVALDLGRLRLRARGSAGGHNGLKSVEEALGTREYPRLRLGCGPAPVDRDLADWVLGDFAEEEWEEVDDMLRRADDAVRCWVHNGTEETMARFNA